MGPNEESVVITNAQARSSPIVYVTPAWQRMCGYCEADAVGKNPRMTQRKDSDPETVRMIGRALREQKPCKVRLINYRGDTQAPFWNCLTINPIFCRASCSFSRRTCKTIRID